MDLLMKPINSFSFNDVVAFCQDRHREGIQLDYKRDLPNDGLSKYFAAFSNTRGGLLIIGVEENRQTGVPTAWNGITEDAQSIERIHQWATNVDPIPNYEVHATDSQNGNFFILVRIFEGERTPYYVQNDARVYVRTGNITPSVDIASPEMLELLFGKKQKADMARRVYLNRSEEIYKASLRRADRERLRAISIERDEYQNKRNEAIKSNQTPPIYHSRYYQNQLGAEASLCTVIVQPYFPGESLISPQEINYKIQEIRDGDGTFRLNFPSLNPESISDGVMTFEWGTNDGEVKNEQIYSTGLVRLSHDVLTIDNGRKSIYIAHLTSHLFNVLKAASNFYRIAEYQGGLIGSLSINGLEGILLDPIFSSRDMFPREHRAGLLPEYHLSLSFDTTVLNDNLAFQQYFIEKVKELYWALGFGEIRSELIEIYLRDKQWYVG